MSSQSVKTDEPKGLACHTKHIDLNVSENFRKHLEPNVRLSEQMKKILLALYQDRQRNQSISDLAMQIIGTKAFYGSNRYVDSTIQVSFNRSLLQLERLGFVLVNRYKDPNRGKGYTYFLTGPGQDVAKAIYEQVKEFIIEWQKLL